MVERVLAIFRCMLQVEYLNMISTSNDSLSQKYRIMQATLAFDAVRQKYPPGHFTVPRFESMLLSASPSKNYPLALARPG